MTTATRKTMWTKSQLMEQMAKEGWQPGNEDGLFVHRKTNKGIDINAEDGNGRIVWITYAMANLVPPPF